MFTRPSHLRTIGISAIALPIGMFAGYIAYLVVPVIVSVVVPAVVQAVVGC